jgi:hypothetical protein
MANAGPNSGSLKKFDDVYEHYKAKRGDLQVIDLQDVLMKGGVNTSLWRFSSSKAKTVADLHEEVVEGECRISHKQGESLRRQTSIIKYNIFNKQRTHVLIKNMAKPRAAACKRPPNTPIQGLVAKSLFKKFSEALGASTKSDISLQIIGFNENRFELTESPQFPTLITAYDMTLCGVVVDGLDMKEIEPGVYEGIYDNSVPEPGGKVGFFL